MTRLYEGMFLLDNDVVRAGWLQAKQSLLEVLAKHGGKIETARRWDERRLAYPIKKKNRATFLLAYFNLPTDAMAALNRELEIGDLVMRSLIVSADEITDEERKLAAEEDTGDFVVPEPPADDAIDAPKSEEDEGEGDAKAEGDAPAKEDAGKDGAESDGEAKPEGEAKSEGESGSDVPVAAATEETKEG